MDRAPGKGEGKKRLNSARWLHRRRRTPRLKPCHATEQAVKTRQQDSKIKRLGKGVVRPRTESVEHILRTAAGGEHEDGNEVLLRPQLCCDRKSVPPRQHDVQDD